MFFMTRRRVMDHETRKALQSQFLSVAEPFPGIHHHEVDEVSMFVVLRWFSSLLQ